MRSLALLALLAAACLADKYIVAYDCEEKINTVYEKTEKCVEGNTCTSGSKDGVITKCLDKAPVIKATFNKPCNNNDLADVPEEIKNVAVSNNKCINSGEKSYESALVGKEYRIIYYTGKDCKTLDIAGTFSSRATCDISTSYLITYEAPTAAEGVRALSVLLAAAAALAVALLA